MADYIPGSGMLPGEGGEEILMPGKVREDWADSFAMLVRWLDETSEYFSDTVVIPDPMATSTPQIDEEIAFDHATPGRTILVKRLKAYGPTHVEENMPVEVAKLVGTSWMVARVEEPEHLAGLIICASPKVRSERRPTPFHPN